CSLHGLAPSARYPLSLHDALPICLLRSAGLTHRPDRIVIVQAATVAADPLPPRISARYSSRNFLIELATGAAAESLSTQIVVPVMFRPRSSSVSRSASVPCPLSIRRRILTSHAVPSRQGVHWPQDSCA